GFNAMSAVCGSIQNSLIEQRRSPASPLLVDPFTNVSRTVSEFDAVRFTDDEEVYGTAVDQADFLEIDCERSAFLVVSDTKEVHAVHGNPAADTQHRWPVLNPQSVDSARHGGCVFLSKPPATRKLLKTNQKQDPR